MNLKLYGTKNCPQCRRTEELIKQTGKPFKKLDMGDPDNLTDLRCLGIFELQAPVLVIQEDPLRYLDSGHLSALSNQDILDILR